MKLDLDEISTLTPPGLLNLRPMVFVVEVMTQLVAREVPGSRMMLKLVRALARYQKHVRVNEAFNLNVKIKAWVMARAERRAWVRGIIGERAIRRWQRRYDNLNAPVLDTPVLDAPVFAQPSNPVHPFGLKNIPEVGLRPYIWKRFAMADLSWLETKPYPSSYCSLNIPLSTSNGGWQNPRESRGFKPVEFWAFELAADFADYAPHTATITATKKTEAQPENSKNIEPDPPPKQVQKSPSSGQKPALEKPP